MARRVERSSPPARSPEARENQLISRAYDLVEQRLIDGSATSQEVVHFLKAGSIRNRMEMEKLREENNVLRAKTEALQSAKNVEKLYSEALDAMRLYGGGNEDDIDDYEDL